MTQSAIALAVEPVRASAIERARQEAADLIERTMVDFAATPARFAYPHSKGRTEYALQMARRATLAAITTTVQIPQYWLKPQAEQNVTTRNDVKCAAFIEEAGEAASRHYTEFVHKLERKVGEHVSAELTGEHVWGWSILKVTKADGTVENWKTRMILNVSVLGKVFNQWPSRKVK